MGSNPVIRFEIYVQNVARVAAILVLVALTTAVPVAAAESQGEAPDEVVAAVGSDGIQRAEVLGGSYFFRPRRVIVKVNVPVELKVLKESGVAPHNIAVRAPEAGVDFSVDLSTEPRTVTFTPTKVGVYPMYCEKRFLFFASHRERGMEGALDVRE